MRGRLWPWALVLVGGAGIGVALGGLPSDTEDTPLRLGASGSTTSTAVVSTTVPAASSTAPASSVAPEIPAFPGSISLGDSGEAVRRWQEQMKARGWTIDVDGRYGPTSVEICRKFQAQKRLEVNGSVDEATWDSTWSAALPDRVS